MWQLFYQEIGILTPYCAQADLIWSSLIDKGYEVLCVSSVDKAQDAGTPSTPLPMSPGATAKHNTKKDPMPKLTKAGMINAMFNKMKKAKKNNLENMYNSVMKDMKDHVENEDEDAIVEDKPSVDYKADFKDDLKALVAEEATLSDEFKQKAEIIFEAAISLIIIAPIEIGAINGNVT